MKHCREVSGRVGGALRRPSIAGMAVEVCEARGCNALGDSFRCRARDQADCDIIEGPWYSWGRDTRLIRCFPLAPRNFSAWRFGAFWWEALEGFDASGNDAWSTAYPERGRP